MTVFSMINRYLRPSARDSRRRALHTAGALARFNRLVLAHQDEAYTFASDLLGDPTLAEQVTLQAVKWTYLADQQVLRSEDFRARLLKNVRAAARDALRTQASLAEKDQRGLAGLDEPSRVLVILIDELNMDYAASAQITGMNIEEVRRRLARARQRLSASFASGRS